MQRDSRLDTIRGLLLILITVNHFASLLPDDWWGRHATWQPFGYVSAAEGFVFVSGFTFSLVYARYTGYSAVLWRKAQDRALLIYGYHLVILFSLAAFYWLVPAYHTAWTKWLTPYPDTPFLSTAAIVLLLHQPPYFDILPMYALFVWVSPVAMTLLHRRKYGVLLTSSVALWVLGQFIHPLEIATQVLFPYHRPGHFNLLSWQLLYVFGLVLGSERCRNAAGRVLQYPALRSLVFLCALLLFLSRHTLLLPEITEGIDRPSLQWLRLANTFLLTAVISSLLAKIPPHAAIRWLALLGQHSLQVFSFHVAAFYLLLPVSWYVAETFGSTGLVPVVLLVVACLWMTASLHKKYRDATIPPVPTQPEPATIR
jgi:hypothetical protein